MVLGSNGYIYWNWICYFKDIILGICHDLLDALLLYLSIIKHIILSVNKNIIKFMCMKLNCTIFKLLFYDFMQQK